jgi:hypothetical protein
MRRVVARLFLALSFPQLACGEKAPREFAVTADRDGLVSLSHPVNQLQGLGGTVLVSDLRFDTESADLGYVADITPLPDGAFAVLDRMESRVAIFDRQGNLREYLGRKGEGPGEFTSPVALESFNGGHLVVWDNDGSFTVFDPRRQLLTAGKVPPVGNDWGSFYFKGPISGADRPFQMTDEDVTRRLVGTPDGVLALASSWHSSSPVDNRGHTFTVVLLDEHLRVKETLGSMPAPTA